MDPKCLLTSTDLQTRRARCQHQLSFLFSFRACRFDKKIEMFQIQDGGRTPYWKSFFFAISRRHIGRSTRNLEWRRRITCRYRSRDQICNFRKFKMAEGRHFENSFISLSQSELSDFEQIGYADANFHSEDGSLTKNLFFQIQDGGRTPYWKSFFFAIYRRLIGQSTRNSKKRWRHANTGHLTKTAIFPNWRWRTAAILESFRCFRHSCNEVMLSIVFQ